MTEKAKRYNEDKLDYTLLPIDALTEETKVWMAGEKKYGKNNWQKLWGADTTSVVMASLLRHAFAILEGEALDKETGLHHAAHIRCNAAMLIYHASQKKPDTEQVHVSIPSSHSDTYGNGTVVGWTDRAVTREELDKLLEEIPGTLILGGCV